MEFTRLYVYVYVCVCPSVYEYVYILTYFSTILYFGLFIAIVIKKVQIIKKIYFRFYLSWTDFTSFTIKLYYIRIVKCNFPSAATTAAASMVIANDNLSILC